MLLFGPAIPLLDMYLRWDFPGGPVAKAHAPNAAAWVWPLFKKLDPPHKKKEKKLDVTCYNQDPA